MSRWIILSFIITHAQFRVEPDDSMLPSVSEESIQTNLDRATLRQMGYKPTIWNMSSIERSAMHRMFVGFLTTDLIVSHRDWHTRNSIGGLNGTGSGTLLGGKHHQILESLRRYIGSSWFRYPLWLPWTPLPPENDLDPKFAQFGPRTTSDPKLDVPPLFTTGENGVTFLDFEDPDDLWRWIGLTIHNSIHAAFGNPMVNSARSPFDIDAFIMWHWFLQLIEEVWKMSPNGQEWVRLHPDHPLLHPMESSFENLDMYRQTEGACPSKPFAPVCQLLQARQNLVHPL